jgi:hypothetical protein
MEYLLQMSNHTSPKNWSDPMTRYSHCYLPSSKQGTDTTSLTVVTMLPCRHRLPRHAVLRLQPHAPGCRRVSSHVMCVTPHVMKILIKSLILS